MDADRAIEMLRLPEGVTARDPLPLCEGCACGSAG
jgi:hypothetical protein